MGADNYSGNNPVIRNRVRSRLRQRLKRATAKEAVIQQKKTQSKLKRLELELQISVKSVNRYRNSEEQHGAAHPHPAWECDRCTFINNNKLPLTAEDSATVATTNTEEDTSGNQHMPPPLDLAPNEKIVVQQGKVGYYVATFLGWSCDNRQARVLWDSRKGQHLIDPDLIEKIPEGRPRRNRNKKLRTLSPPPAKPTAALTPARVRSSMLTGSMLAAVVTPPNTKSCDLDTDNEEEEETEDTEATAWDKAVKVKVEQFEASAKIKAENSTVRSTARCNCY